MQRVRWVGSEKNFVDEVNVQKVGETIAIGRFGGNSSAGQHKNEDGCLVWTKEHEWEFAVLLDAHDTAQSAELVITTIEEMRHDIEEALTLSGAQGFDAVNELLLASFTSKEFQQECKEIEGETACLVVIRKENILSWFSVGDCLLYVHHPELAAFGEYQQNHRSFFEWIGRVSTFNKAVPCFSTGRKELRRGINHILLTTDGLVECPGTDFSDPEKLFGAFEGIPVETGIVKLLETIREKNVKDSTTILSWVIHNDCEGSRPSNQK